MWAQLITTRIRAGREGELTKLGDEFNKLERSGSGWIRSTMMLDQKDPSRAYLLVVFESEEQARARESDPERQAALGPARELMAEIFEGEPEFVDLTVAAEYA
jgi:antibiotic biosynthesis monooxygenase (ABM) superfamily enzyme